MSDLKPDIESAKFEITRLENKIKEMSELCLTNAEVNKIKADAVLGFEIPELDSIGDWRVVDASLKNYADKLERGDV